MHVVFLGARLPLTKTFLQQPDGVLAATPYPQVSKVTSFHEQASTLAEFYDLMNKHAAKGHCLFGGQLQHPLQNESRASKTLKSEKTWVVFDFDKVTAIDAADAVRRYLPKECQNVSYIAQLSASMFRPDVKTWSGHVFMLLKTPVEEVRLKQWIEWVNFNVPQLEDQIRLSDSMQALHWPLDRTAVYNSKLIYIAPPKCHGFEPPVDKPIMLVKGKLPSLVISNFTPIDTQQIRQKINAMRRAVGENEIDYHVTLFEGHEILKESGEVNIHGIRTSGDHYIRFNLNGGDSYAYFIDLRNPGVIRNFKGEPFLRTDEAAPDLYKSLVRAAPKITAKPALDEGTDVLAFYATNQSSQVKVGSYSAIERKLTLNSASETSARAWLAEYGLVQKGFLPHMDLTFDPTTDIQYIPGCTRINTFRATEYMAREKTSNKPSTLADIPPVMNKTIRSAMGNPTDEVLLHFFNWLAYIFQTRKKAGTAWVFNGRTGTGKGSFVKWILTPLFGKENVKVLQFGLLKAEFNGYLENSLFVVFEEADVHAVENTAELAAKLRHYITDSPIEIRKMRTDSFSAENYTNFFFNANTRAPAMVTGDDRRYNFAERQEQQLQFTPNELRVLSEGLELDAMADMLARWPVDEYKVTTVIDTAAKREAHEATTTINQLIAEAIIKGDLQFFIERMPSDSEAMSDFHNRFNPIGMFRAQIDRYIESATNNKSLIVPEEELFTIFRTLIPDTRYFQDSKTWRRRHYKALGLDVDKQHRLAGNERKRGILVGWQVPTDRPEAAPISNNVIQMGGKKGKK
jgi:hypothetical protein